MAVTGKLQADFASFYSAVDQAEVKLRSFEDSSSKVESQLSRMVDNFSGRNVIQQATLMNEAVERGGGISKLTQAELQKLQTVTTEAVEKMKVLGISVPEGMQRIATSAAEAGKHTSLLDTTFAHMTASFSAGMLITRAVDGLREWTSEAIDSAGHVVDLATKTGLSTETIQQMAYVAKQTGTELDTFTKAAFKLGVNISGGSGSVRAAVNELGLSFSQIRSMSPDEQFNAITRALENMVDPQERNRIAVQLFGKSAAEIMPAIVEGYHEIKEAASISGDAQLRAVKAQTDAWEGFKSKTQSAFVSLVGSTIMAGDALLVVEGRMVGIDVESILAADAVKKTGGAIKDTSKDAVDYAAALTNAQAELDSLSEVQLEDAETAKRLGATTEEITDTFGLSAEAQKLLTEKVTAHKKELSDAAAATKKYDEAVAEIKSSGDGWRGTLAGINTETAKAATADLAAGVAQDKLAIFYGLTATQVKSLATALTEEQKIQQLTDRSVVETTKLWEQYYALRVAHGGTTTDAQLAQIDAWFNSEVAKLKQSDKNYAEHYAALVALADESTQSILVDWSYIAKNSRQTLEDQYNKSLATYEAMTRIDGEFSATAIANAKERMYADRQALQDWRSAGEQATDSIKAHVGGVTGEIKILDHSWVTNQDIADAAISKTEVRVRALSGALETLQENYDRMHIGGSVTYDLSTDAGMAKFKELNPMAELMVGKEYFKTHTLEDALREGLVNLYAKWNSSNSATPSFASGVENFAGGVAKVHKDELLVNLPAGTDVIPAGRSGGGGTQIFNINLSGVMGDKYELARIIKSALGSDYMSQGRRVPVGGG